MERFKKTICEFLIVLFSIWFFGVLLFPHFAGYRFGQIVKNFATGYNEASVTPYFAREVITK